MHSSVAQIQELLRISVCMRSGATAAHLDGLRLERWQLYGGGGGGGNRRRG